jgi:3-hydroxyacyl-CoA dehydrogenase
MLVNEAAFTVGDGVAEAATVDRAMQLGANYPHGPLAWGQRLGWDKVVRSLDHLRAEYGEERYRVAPLLRRWARRKQQLARSGPWQVRPKRREWQRDPSHVHWPSGRLVWI